MLRFQTLTASILVFSIGSNSFVFAGSSGPRPSGDGNGGSEPNVQGHCPFKSDDSNLTALLDQIRGIQPTGDGCPGYRSADGSGSPISLAGGPPPGGAPGPALDPNSINSLGPIPQIPPGKAVETFDAALLKITQSTGTSGPPGPSSASPPSGSGIPSVGTPPSLSGGLKPENLGPSGPSPIPPHRQATPTEIDNYLAEMSTSLLSLVNAADDLHPCFPENVRTSIEQAAVSRVKAAAIAAQTSPVLGAVVGNLVAIVGNFLFKRHASNAQIESERLKKLQDAKEASCLYYQFYPYAGDCNSSHKSRPAPSTTAPASTIQLSQTAQALNDLSSGLKEVAASPTPESLTKLDSALSGRIPNPSRNGEITPLFEVLQGMVDFLNHQSFGKLNSSKLQAVLTSFQKLKAETSNNPDTLSAESTALQNAIKSLDSGSGPAAGFQKLANSYWKSLERPTSPGDSPIEAIAKLERQRQSQDILNLTAAVAARAEHVNAGDIATIQNHFTYLLTTKRDLLKRQVANDVGNFAPTNSVTRTEVQRCNALSSAVTSCTLLQGAFYFKDGSIASNSPKKGVKLQGSDYSTNKIAVNGDGGSGASYLELCGRFVNENGIPSFVDSNKGCGERVGQTEKLFDKVDGCAEKLTQFQCELLRPDRLGVILDKLKSQFGCNGVDSSTAAPTRATPNAQTPAS